VHMLNVAAGGTLHMDLREVSRTPAIEHDQRTFADDDTRPTHAVDIETGSILHALLSHDQVDVCSTHRQAVNDVAPGFVVTAKSPDGIIEGIERRGHAQWGMQFHPERQRRLDGMWNRVFQRLVQDANQWRQTHQTVRPGDDAATTTPDFALTRPSASPSPTNV